jgi:hypothetical protein
MQAPNSRVVIDLPAAYAPSPLFSGFIDEGTGASFVVLELPAHAYEDMVKGFTPEALAKKGIAAARPAPLERHGDYISMVAEQASPAGTFSKHFVLFRDDTTTALVSANIPKASLDTGEIKLADIAKALSSARLAPQAAPAKPVFTVTYLGPFQDAGAFVGQTRIYTLDGKMEPPQKGVKRPSVIIAPALDRRPVTDLEATARTALAALAGERDIGDVTSARLTIGGLPGVEHVLPPRPADSTSGEGFYQVILLPKAGGYLRLVGTAPADQWPLYLPEFRKIAASLKPEL